MEKKKKNGIAISKRKEFEERVLIWTGIYIFFVSFIIKYKEFTGVPTYDGTATIGNAVNLFTYYKLVFMGILVALLLVLYIYKNSRYSLNVRMDYITITCGLIIGGATVSMLFNPVGHMQIIGFFSRTNGLLAYITLFLFIFLVASFNVGSPGKIEQLCVGLAGFTIVITLIGIFQFFGHDIFNSHLVRSMILLQGMDTSGIEEGKIASAAFSVFAHYNYYSGFCSIFFPLMTVLAVKESSIKKRILYIVSAVMLFLGVVTSVSQSGLFTAVVMLLLMLVFFASKKTGLWLTVIYALSALCAVLLAVRYNIQTYVELGPRIATLASKPINAIVILVGFVALIGITYFRDRFEKKKKLILKIVIIVGVTVLILGLAYLVSNVAGTHKHMFTDRGYAWNNTYELLKKSPLVGYGPDNFYYAFPQNSPDASQYSGGEAFDKPHNMFLQTYMDAGLIGFVGFVGLLLFYMLSLVKSDKFYEDSPVGVFLQGSLVMLVAYMIQGIVNDNHINIQISLFFVMALGMGLVRDQSV